MRLRRAAGIADMPNDLADADLVPRLHFYRSRPHMRIEHIAMRRDFFNDVIARRIVEIERHGVHCSFNAFGLSHNEQRLACGLPLAKNGWQTPASDYSSPARASLHEAYMTPRLRR